MRPFAAGTRVVRLLGLVVEVAHQRALDDLELLDVLDQALLHTLHDVDRLL